MSKVNRRNKKSNEEKETIRKELEKWPPRPLKLREVSEILGISYWATYRLVQFGVISSVQMGGKGCSWLIPRAALLEYLNKLERKPKAIPKVSLSTKEADYHAQLITKCEHLRKVTIREKKRRERGSAKLMRLLGYEGHLEDIVAHGDNSRQRKRAEALVWLNEGQSVSRVARKLRVTRQTIYNWANKIDQRKGSVYERLEDAERSGRPNTKSRILDEALSKLLKKNPIEVGYRATRWTNTLIRNYIYRHHHLQVSHQSIRQGIKRTGYRWKVLGYAPMQSANT